MFCFTKNNVYCTFEGHIIHDCNTWWSFILFLTFCSNMSYKLSIESKSLGMIILPQSTFSFSKHYWLLKSLPRDLMCWVYFGLFVCLFLMGSNNSKQMVVFDWTTLNKSSLHLSQDGSWIFKKVRFFSHISVSFSFFS